MERHDRGWGKGGWRDPHFWGSFFSSVRDDYRMLVLDGGFSINDSP